MTFSALDSELTGPLFATAEMRTVFSDRAHLTAMLKIEAALAEAEANHGIVPKTLAPAIRRLSADDLDIAAIGVATANAGVPAIPFVKAVEALLPEKLRGHFHRGATSQDILDTATVLQIADGLALAAADIAAVMDGLAALAARHRKTPQAGRSYGQHAAPITFGYAVSVWLDGIAECAAALPAVRERALVASLGGPVGTLAALGDKGPAVLADFATSLGLSSPPTTWHASRGRIVAVGAWLATLIGALAKMATDVVFLSSTEVGEVSEAPVVGRGGSSAMPHKRNPVSATVILAAHGAAGGLLATLIHAMAAADQRPAGAWHAESHALPQLFGLASGALREARRLAEGLVVHKERMSANLELTRGLLFADAVAARLAPMLGRKAAHDIVERAAASVHDTGETLAAAMARDGGIPKALRRDVEAAFDLAPAVNAAAKAADRTLKHAKAVHRVLAIERRR